MFVDRLNELKKTENKGCIDKLVRDYNFFCKRSRPYGAKKPFLLSLRKRRKKKVYSIRKQYRTY